MPNLQISGWIKDRRLGLTVHRISVFKLLLVRNGGGYGLPVESDGVYGAHENSSDVCGDHVEAVHVKIKRMKSALIFVSHSRACSVVLSCCIE